MRLQKSINSTNEQNTDDNSQNEPDTNSIRKINAELAKEINQLRINQEARKEEHKKAIEEHKAEIRDLKAKLKEKEQQPPENLASTAESINNLESRIIEMGDSCKERFAKIEAEFAFHESDLEDLMNILKTYQSRTERLETELEYIGSLFSQVGKSLKDDKKD